MRNGNFSKKIKYLFRSTWKKQYQHGEYCCTEVCNQKMLERDSHLIEQWQHFLDWLPNRIWISKILVFFFENTNNLLLRKIKRIIIEMLDWFDGMLEFHEIHSQQNMFAKRKLYSNYLNKINIQSKLSCSDFLQTSFWLFPIDKKYIHARLSKD